MCYLARSSVTWTCKKTVEDNKPCPNASISDTADILVALRFLRAEGVFILNSQRVAIHKDVVRLSLPWVLALIHFTKMSNCSIKGLIITLNPQPQRPENTE